jgi:hypothetical protein
VPLVLVLSLMTMSLAPCRRQPTSSGTHHHPGSISSDDRGALHLDAIPVPLLQC